MTVAKHERDLGAEGLMIELQGAHQRLAVLEAEVARLTDLKHRAGIALTDILAESLMRKGEIQRLDRAINALRQPCSHEPKGSVVDCAWCRVRAWLVATYRGPGESVVVHRFDAAVQSVRERRNGLVV